MYRTKVSMLAIVFGVGLLLAGNFVSNAGAELTETEKKTARAQILNGEGLIGTYYNSEDFYEREVGMIDILNTIDYVWGDDRGQDWSAIWTGFIEGPATAQVTFIAEARDGLRLTVGNTVVIDGLREYSRRSGKVSMVKGKKEAIKVEFFSANEQALLRLYWKWPGQEKTIIPASALSHSTDELPDEFMVFDFDNRPSEEDDDDDDVKVLDFLPRFTGGSPPYANTDFHDGRLRPVVGAHNFEVIRCNRKHPQWVTDDIPSYPDVGFEDVGFTYNHQPMICYWQGKFWVIYESGPAHEHQQPCYALVTWSEDGRNWHKPQTIFPAEKFRNRKENNEMQYSISHQRMNWYVAPNGRLIACGYHGMYDTPNDGRGVGRTVREIKGPGSYGPIYWARYNEYQGYNKDNSPHYPYYKEAPDKGFVKAVDSLLADKLVVQQWYEEDRDDESGLFALTDSDYGTRYLKAFCWYRLPDSRIVGMWKWKRMVVADKWKPGHISRQGMGRDIYYGGAKIWGQRLSNGRYALVYNPVEDTTYRHPLSVTTGDDGLNFGTYFLNVQGETPLMRFGGANKDGGGAQYVRGIIPGNGTPPDGAMWLICSSNKEDIWASRVPVPVRGTVEKDVDDDFEDMKPGGIVTDWCIYSGIWVPVAVVEKNENNVLRLKDKAPYNYAKAVRVFPETTKARVSFNLRAQKVGREGLEIEIQNYKGQRPVRIVLENGKIIANEGSVMKKIASLSARKWMKVNINVDTKAGKYDLSINGEKLVSGAAFAETLDNSDNPYKSNFDTPTVERVVFRTGGWRMKDFSRYGTSANDFRKHEPDLPNPDEPVDKAVFDIDNFETKTLKMGQYKAQTNGVKFGLIELKPDMNLVGEGKVVDTIAFWEADNPDNTLMFVTAKDNQLVEVWKYPFEDNEHKPLRHSSFGTSTVNGVAVDQDNDLLYVVTGDEASTVSVFELPSLKFKYDFIKAKIALGGEPNICLMRRKNGQKLVFITSETAVLVFDAKSLKQVGAIEPGFDIETVIADEYHDIVYVPDEHDNTGVWAYTPEGESYTKNGKNNFGGNGIVQRDAEGIWIYYRNGQGSADDGSGFIILSDQRKDITDFEFFDRQSWEHLGVIRLTGVDTTDGIAVTQKSMRGYPMGVFAAINDDISTVVIGIDRIIKAISEDHGK